MSESHGTPQGAKQAHTVTKLTIDADALMRSVGLEVAPPLQENAQGVDERRHAESSQLLSKAAQATRLASGDGSVIAEGGPVEGAGHSAVTPQYVTELLSSTRHKLAAAQKQFWDLVTETSAQGVPHPNHGLVKSALMMSQVPMQTQVPLQQAQAQMQQFLPQHQQMAGIRTDSLLRDGAWSEVIRRPKPPTHIEVNEGALTVVGGGG